MILRAREIERCSISATDGEFGRVDDLLFDDERWTARYLVVNTGRWLLGRRLLVSPRSVHAVDADGHVLDVDLTMHQIEKSPPLAEHEPITRRFESEFHGYYGWPYYWVAPYVNDQVAGANPPPEDRQREAPEEDLHLQSVRDVRGYHIRASDGDIGHVVDLLVDEDDWTIRYLEVDTRNWLPGKHVLMAPGWIEQVRWAERSVHVGLVRALIESAPPYEQGMLIDPGYEVAMFDHYGRSMSVLKRPVAHR